MLVLCTYILCFEAFLGGFWEYILLAFPFDTFQSSTKVIGKWSSNYVYLGMALLPVLFPYHDIVFTYLAIVPSSRSRSNPK